MIRICSMVVALASTTALAHGPLPKVDVCHWSKDTQTFEVINISEHALEPHLTNHGDAFPGAFWADNDGDGYGGSDQFDACPQIGYVTSSNDCDDTNPNVNPGMNEVPYNGLDDDCDPSTPDDDLDGDGYGIATDCDDSNPNINPGMDEVTGNGLDDDCDPGTLDDPGDCSTAPGTASWAWLVPFAAFAVRRRKPSR